MNLRFKVPKFYVKKYGADESIDSFCETIENVVEGKIYSTKVDSIDFIPIIVPKHLLEEGLGQEFTKYDLKYKVVALARQIDFEDYNNGDEIKKKTLLKECLITGLKEIEIKSKLNVDEMSADIESVD